MQFPLHTAVAIVGLAGLLYTAHQVRPEIKLPDTTAVLEDIVNFTPERTPLLPLVRRLPPPSDARPVGSIESALLDDRNGGLDHFYESLLRTEQGHGAGVTRVVHYGDSPTTADLITSDIRDQLQKRFGSAGHGFTLVGKPWAWYQHRNVSLSASGWQIQPGPSTPGADGMFGLGGVSFTSTGAAQSKITLDDDGLTRFEVWFLRQPGGGTITLLADGATLGEIDTAADQKAPGFATFQAKSEVHELLLRTTGDLVRVFGVTAERPAPGVVYDSLGLNGASITVLSHNFNERHFAAELQHRDPALVIINYGTNESGFAAFVDSSYERELREAIRRVRTALPEASILIMSPMDRGQRTSLSEIQTLPTIPKIVGIQHRVAKDTGCGFFNTFEAMGGEGTIARWYEGTPRLVSADFIHPTPAGGKIVASAFTKEIIGGLNRFKLRQLLRAGEKSNPATHI